MHSLPQTRICLWSGPRNVSTALMYSFAQRPDTSVVDEPLYAYYLLASGANHPGREEVLAAMEHDGEKVVKNVILGESDKPVLFIKNMAHHLPGLNKGFLAQLANVLLIRDPREMLPSLVKQIPEPTLRDTALALQWELFQYLQSEGQAPLVLDAKLLLLNPEEVLKKLHKALNIPFYSSMLHWQAGARPEDGVWAPYWYHQVHKSTGFVAYQQKNEPVHEALKPLLAECEKYYALLRQYAIA